MRSMQHVQRAPTHLPIAFRRRYFLSGFRIPGEAQIIDRMMTQFADRYSVCNETISKGILALHLFIIRRPVLGVQQNDRQR